MRRAALLPAVFRILTILSPGSAIAQPGFTLKGTVVDPTGAPIAGARVSIDAGSRPPSETVVSDQTGVFALTLNPGRHTLTISSEGFEPLRVAVDAPATGADSRTLTLQIAGFRDTVNVAARPRYVAPAVTSATKTLTPLRDVPQSVTVITKQLIADQSMQSIGDTIRYVPGVSVRRKNRSTTWRSS
jgi:outer membrane receptor protein involved in Fe transport